MIEPSSGEVNRLLDDSTGDSGDVLDRLMPMLYTELRRLAAHYLRGERSTHTLQPTALVNEVYLRFAEQKKVTWRNRAHFVAIAARTMRRILVDYARRHGAAKRGGARKRVTFDEAMAVDRRRNIKLIDFDDALRGLAAMDPRASAIVSLYVFK